MIKTISFDIGNTLIENNKEDKITKLESILKRDRSEFIDQYKKLFQTQCDELINIVSIFLKKIRIEDERIQEQIIEMFTQNQSINCKISGKKREVLQKLKERGFTIIAISNNCIHSNNYDNYLKGLNIFDKIFYSYEIGYCKPDKRVFKFVEQYYNITNKEIIHIGDSIKSDYNAGIENGWNALLYDPKNNYEDMNVKRITNFNEIICYIDNKENEKN